MTAEAVAFWILAAIAVAGAIGVVAAPKAVYSAIFLAGTMISLAMLYVAQDALFLGVVQVVVRPICSTSQRRPSRLLNT